MFTKEETEKLLMKPWEKIVSSGGIIGKQKYNDIYIASAYILLFIEGKYLALSSTEVSLGEGRDNYDFFVEVSKEEFPFDPKIARQYRPPFSPIKTFPPDCRLDYLRDFGIEKLDYEVHPKSYTQYYNDVNYGLLLASALVITCKNRVKFKIEPSEDSLACLEISMIS